MPGRGGEVGGLFDTFRFVEGVCGWHKPDMLEPSPPAVKLCVILSCCGLSQNFIALRT